MLLMAVSRASVDALDSQNEPSCRSVSRLEMSKLPVLGAVTNVFFGFLKILASANGLLTGRTVFYQLLLDPSAATGQPTVQAGLFPSQQWSGFSLTLPAELVQMIDAFSDSDFYKALEE